MVYPSSYIIARLKKIFGSKWDISLINDYVSDSIPSHIIGPKIFLLVNGNNKYVAKIGFRDDLEKEEKIINEVRLLLKKNKKNYVTSKKIVLPKIISVVNLDNSDLSALVMTFHGLHTLEVHRTHFDNHAMETELKDVLLHLANSEIIWPAIIPRNIVVSKPYSIDTELCAVDWERGYLTTEHAKTEKVFLVRCIELLEEMSSFTENTVPYWSSLWPTPQELYTESASINMRNLVDLSQCTDSRIIMFADWLELPKMISLPQYFRLIYIFAAFCERKPSTFSILYAADLLSEWTGIELRLNSMLLSWFLNQHNRERQERFFSEIVRISYQLHLCWRSEVGEIEMRKAVNLAASYTEELLEQIAREELRTTEWKKKLLDEAKKFVNLGANKNNIPDFRILYNLE